jgi:hypothetical protein
MGFDEIQANGTLSPYMVQGIHGDWDTLSQ